MNDRGPAESRKPGLTCLVTGDSVKCHMRERPVVMLVQIDGEPRARHRPIYSDCPSFPPGVTVTVENEGRWHRCRVVQMELAVLRVQTDRRIA